MLRGVVTGLAHSGTSITSALVMSAPGVFGAFECGMLAVDKPANFANNEYKSAILAPLNEFGWGVSADGFKRITEVDSHEDMYRALKVASPAVLGDEQIIDKTPRYVDELVKVMGRVPVPFILTFKTWDAQRESYVVRRGIPEHIAKAMFVNAVDQIKQARKKYRDRVAIVEYSKLLRDPAAALERVFSLLELKWDDQYCTLEAYNKKWADRGGPTRQVEPLRRI